MHTACTRARKCTTASCVRPETKQKKKGQIDKIGCRRRLSADVYYTLTVYLIILYYSIIPIWAYCISRSDAAFVKPLTVAGQQEEMGAEISKEIESAKKTPPFSLSSPRYDQGSFVGRTLHFYSVNDPFTLARSNAEIAAARERLEQYKRDGVGKAEELWEARRLVESAVHPDTGDVIPAPLRFSAFVPMNMFIVTATLSPIVLNSFAMTGMCHLVNQSYNAAINFANRNASNPVPTDKLLEGFAGAVTTSLSFGLSATWMTRKVASMPGASPKAAGIIRATLPFLASALAGSANVGLMRRNELTDGVDMYDHEGVCRGKSVKAGETGIMKCAAARMIWNVPAMFLPAVFMNQLDKVQWLRRVPVLRMAADVGVATSCLMVAVSPALAVFPQRDCLEVTTLEPGLQGLKDSQGNPVDRLWYNKGL
jgi:tricarboxylate carrier